MEEAAKITSNELKKCRWSWNCSIGDRISELPDEILERILSLLTLKEAARTSVISSRWKTLWTYYAGNLDLDRSDIIYNISNSEQFELLPEERVKYVRFVNQILNSVKSAQIDSFTVCFDLSLEFYSDINCWIKFAVEKRVKRLKLDLERVLEHYGDCYAFELQSVWNNSNIEYLTHIDFHCVNISQEVVEYLLCSCPSLKSLAISVSQSLVGLNVLPESSPKLEHLEIVNCDNVGFIDAPSLKSLTYYGLKESICLKNMPKLRELSLGGDYCDYIVYHTCWRNFSISPSQIEKLKLDLTAEKFDIFPLIPRTFKNLEQLEFVVFVTDNRRIISYTLSLLDCPKLYRFSVEMEWDDETIAAREFRPHEFKGNGLECLRVVELRCFRGHKVDVDLARQLLVESPLLEKVIIDTRHPYNRNEDDLILAKDRAWQLLAAESFNPRVELIVL